MTRQQLAPLAAFLRDRTIKAPGLTVRTRDLHHTFVQSLPAMSRSGWPRRVFADGLAELGIEQGKHGGQIVACDTYLPTDHCVVADGNVVKLPL